jgi:hypothetical protein
MQVNLTNQEVVKFAYITKEIIGLAWGKKLTNAKANCYEECYYTVIDLLEEVDKEYLNNHKRLCNFFLTGNRLTNEKNILKWEKKVKANPIRLNVKSKKPRKSRV